VVGVVIQKPSSLRSLNPTCVRVARDSAVGTPRGWSFYLGDSPRKASCPDLAGWRWNLVVSPQRRREFRGRCCVSSGL